MDIDKVALDRWITGNWGEDQFRDWDDEEEDTPDESDGYIVDGYSWTEALFDGKSLGRFQEEEDAREAIKVRGIAYKFWPNVWHVSDHGNHHLIENFWSE